MRSLESARASWQELQHYRTLRELKDAVRLDGFTSSTTKGFRSACWKAFLLFDTLDVDEWQRTLTSSRSAYNSLHAHFFRLLDNPDDVGTGYDPLTQDPESSPWQQLRKDEELRAEIKQDVERQAILQSLEARRMLTDILFTFCKLNPDVGYRQGMHEIAAPILWVVEADAIDVGESSKTLGEDGVIKTMFDADHIEHDSFALFGQVMQSAKSFYLSEGPVSIAARSKHIFDVLLHQVDPDLVKHLETLDVLPQVFLIRWIRLLFGREFEFESVLALWDVLFAEDPSLELVDHICLTMLLRIRWHLLDADYNNALGLLLKYPELDKDLPAQSLGLDAMYLRAHMDGEGGSYLVLKYTGRPLVGPGRPTTPPALQRNITQFSGLNAVRQAARASLSPSRTPRQSSNIEAILQNTAKNIYAQSEKLGIGKAVRNAVDEVHKKAQEIRDTQAPSPPPWRQSGNSRILDRLKELEARNKRLSDLLSNSVNELWDYQRLITEDEKAGNHANQEESVEKLSAAIARVQFVQVYLDEPSLALPDDEAPAKDGATSPPREADESSAKKTTGSDDPSKLSAPNLSNANIEPEQQFRTETEGLVDPADFEDFDDPVDIPTTKPPSSPNPPLQSQPPVPSSSNSNPVVDSTPTKVRPTLDQSPFSFMLGQDKQATDASSPSGSFSRIVKTKPRPSGTSSSLFGTPDLSSAQKDDTRDPLSGNDDDEFDIGSLRRAKVGKK